jgi:hypothetical protein
VPPRYALGKRLRDQAGNDVTVRAPFPANTLAELIVYVERGLLIAFPAEIRSSV